MYALVKDGQVVRTSQTIPPVLDNISAFHLLDEAARKARGFYEVVDRRAALGEGERYGADAFTFDGSNVYRDAPVIPAPQSYVDAKAAREYAPLAALAQMTPAQIQTYINNNVTDLASHKTAIKTLAVAVGILARNI